MQAGVIRAGVGDVFKPKDAFQALNKLTLTT